jgi:hypothetical protein
LYADWIACGVKQVRATASHAASLGGVVPAEMNWKSLTAG